jgi:methylmalonyl-CoA mutase
MTKAIGTGLPKLRIEEAAAIKQARIDTGKEVIVGVNRYEIEDHEKAALEILSIDNTKVLQQQVDRLNQLRNSRKNDRVSAALKELEKGASTGVGNLLDLAVKCARERATLGEISNSLEAAYGRYQATIQAISGVFSKEVMEDKEFTQVRTLVEKFTHLEGRRPRIMIAKMGQDGHDRGAKVIATAFADIGFDVDIGPLFQTPQEAARQAVENDVHVLGVSSLAAGHKTLVPQVIQELEKLNRGDIMVVAGGVIPEQDYEALYQAGVFGIFGPGTKITVAAGKILHLLLESIQDS